MKYTPRSYQSVASDHAVEFLLTAERGQKTLYSAPTGSGKSVIEIMVQERLLSLGHVPWLVSPRDEILAGIMDKRGVSGDPLDHCLATPVKLRNRLMFGVVKTPTHLIVDESHHETAETYQQIDLLTGMCPAVGYTATPYRGSPRGTTELLARWGDPLPILTLEEAARMGVVSVPTFETLPLVDDDIVEVVNGEFSVTSLEGATVDRLGDLADHCKRWFSDGYWDRATVFAAPTTLCARRLAKELKDRGLPAFCVVADTSPASRRAVFEAVVLKLAALIHINVVSEGVDLPLRRLVDLAPTMSPVKWVQHLGRITRPIAEGEPPPEYVCTNRNLMRHAYAMEGAVPVSAVAQAEAVFPRTERAHTRVLGLEAIGRFKPTSTKLLSGAYIYVYSLSVPLGGGTNVEYGCLVPPTSDPIWAIKMNTVKDGVKSWGNWVSCPPPESLKGFGSVPPRPVSEKQRAWWDRSAARHGLDPSQEVDRKSFVALPLLADLGVRLT